jgi:hypothetical protein
MPAPALTSAISLGPSHLAQSPKSALCGVQTPATHNKLNDINIHTRQQGKRQGLAFRASMGIIVKQRAASNSSSICFALRTGFINP